MDQRSSTSRWVLAASAAAIVLTALSPSSARAASIQGPRRSALERLEEGDAIRNRLLLRGGRFEAAPVIGFTLNDAFRRNILYGAQLSYHVSDSWAVGVTAFGGTAINSALADRIEDERPEKADGGFSDVGVLGSLDVTYTPLVGKYALFGSSIVNYDMHILAGVGGAQSKGAKDAEGWTVAPVVGIGMRTFVTPGVAVTLQFRDYLFSAAPNAVANPSGEVSSSDEFSNNFAVTMGVGFYFPQEPEIGN